MTLFGLHEAALIVLLGISVLAYPRIVTRVGRWIGGRHALYRYGERSPADDAEQAYRVASPALQQSSRRRQAATLVQRLLK